MENGWLLALMGLQCVFEVSGSERLELNIHYFFQHTVLTTEGLLMIAACMLLLRPCVQARLTTC